MHRISNPPLRCGFVTGDGRRYMETATSAPTKGTPKLMKFERILLSKIETRLEVNGTKGA